MALVDNAWYVNFGDGATTGYYALAVWATGATIAAGALRRQLAAPAVGSERVFVCVVAGTTHASTEPTWVITRGGKTTDNTVTWQECTGIAALNGDATNTPSWTITATPPGGVKNTAVTLGQVIKRDSGASYQICTTAGTAGNGAEPSFSNTAGTTTSDNTITWTSLGVVGNFTGWQAPHARLGNACATNWGQAGNSFYVRDNHAETQSTSNTITIPGSAASPCTIYSLSQTATLPPGSGDLTATAAISTTGASNLTISGVNFIMDGFVLTCGTGATLSFTNNANGASGKNLKFVTGTTSTLSLGSTNTFVRLVNCTWQASSTTSLITAGGGRVLWENTASAIVAGTLPTSLFNGGAGNGGVILRGVDLSALGSGKTLVSGASIGGDWTFVNCMFGASVTVAATPTDTSGKVDVISSDSGATNYRHERYVYAGTQTVETTIVRTGGASDGTTPIAWKVVTTANSRWLAPYVSLPITIWNDTTGAAITVTLFGIWGGGAVPNNDDVWMEAMYLGSSSTPLGSFSNSTKTNNLATAAALTTDASTWGGSTTKFLMSVTFTPQMKGPINIVVKAAKASSTFYIDPMPSISGITVSKSAILAPGVFANELSSGSSSGGFIIGGQ